MPSLEQDWELGDDDQASDAYPQAGGGEEIVSVAAEEPAAGQHFNVNTPPSAMRSILQCEINRNSHAFSCLIPLQRCSRCSVYQENPELLLSVA